MKFTLKNVKDLQKSTDNDLVKEACNYIVDRWDDYDDKKSIVNEVLEYGCKSGIVSSLIYYTDTSKFFEKYKNEINEALYYSDIKNPCDYFEDWDDEDSLCLDAINQNILAWYGFEYGMHEVCANFDYFSNENDNEEKEINGGGNDE